MIVGREKLLAVLSQCHLCSYHPWLTLLLSASRSFKAFPEQACHMPVERSSEYCLTPQENSNRQHFFVSLSPELCFCPRTQYRSHIQM